MKNGADTLCVEILVTHAVDENKEQKITAAKLPTIEIDLGSMIEDFDEDSVTEIFLSAERLCRLGRGKAGLGTRGSF